MSTLKVSAIQSPSTTDGGLAISSTGAVSGALPVPNRNLLYNGAMQVAQRGTSTAGITTSGYYTADRWYSSLNNAGTWTQSVEADGPGAFAKSLKMLCTTAYPTVTTNTTAYVQQRLEGQDLQRLQKGAAGAQQLTVSFWVKSNVTGTYIASLYDNDNARSISAPYTISGTGTWEQKFITFAADATGALGNDNGYSLGVWFWLGAGSNFTSGTLRDVWDSTSVSADYAPGQTNLAAAVNNYWQVTGVQLETGPVATEFEHRSFGDELARCQRYYEKSYSYGTAAGTATAVALFTTGGFSNQVGNIQSSVTMSVQKRAVPTVSLYSAAGTASNWEWSKASLSSNGSATAYVIGDKAFTVYVNIGANWTAGSLTGQWVAEAEL